jgi:hypothetical protein
VSGFRVLSRLPWQGSGYRANGTSTQRKRFSLSFMVVSSSFSLLALRTGKHIPEMINNTEFRSLPSGNQIALDLESFGPASKPMLSVATGA